MPSHGPLEAWITLNGVRLPEFNTQHVHLSNAHNVVICSIPSQAGGYFELVVKDHRDPEHPTLSCTVVVDGAILGPHILQGGVLPTAPNTMCIGESLGPDGMRRNLIFKDMSSTTDHRNPHLTGLSELGQIRIQICAARLWSRFAIGAQSQVATAEVVLDQGNANQHSVPQETQTVRSDPVRSIIAAQGPWRWIFQQSGPLVEFIFKYQIIDPRVKQNMATAPVVIPRAAHDRPLPTEAGRAMATLLTTAIQKELKDQLNPMTEELRQLKICLLQPEMGEFSRKRKRSSSEDNADQSLSGEPNVPISTNALFQSERVNHIGRWIEVKRKDLLHEITPHEIRIASVR